MSYDMVKLMYENLQSGNTLAEIFCVVPEFYEYISVEKLDLSARAYSSLTRGDRNIYIRSLKDLLNLTVGELYSIRNLGKVSLIDILECTQAYLEKNKPTRPDDNAEVSDDLLYAGDKNNNDIFDIQVKLRDNVRNIRKSKHQSQSEFANNCGITLSILRSIENGVSNPKLSTLQKIANYAGLTVSKLFE